MSELIRVHLRKELYVIVLQDVESAPPRALTPVERLQGWRNGQDWSGNPLAINEHHQLGSLHTRTGPHLLAWEVHPGEQVIACLTVELIWGIDQPEGWQSHRWHLLEASCSPTVSSPAPVDYFLADLDSVLGRSVMLGEDGAEDAFGNSALQAQLEAALEDDWRRSQCNCQLIPAPEDDLAYKVWCARRDRAEVRVVRHEEKA